MKSKARETLKQTTSAAKARDKIAAVVYRDIANTLREYAESGRVETLCRMTAGEKFEKEARDQAMLIIGHLHSICERGAE